ncbi:FkbM family methyltransferase [Methanococcoides burtonii]|uniref:Methyltransferase n=1 Tax=Methanococcoides burtonii (strain DSM 6242 / NBRC 107633 / OCM 468 / ACE-M) TaxID=259564 RepID=Q12VN2_METBU|nr:FkbM family methyltransferase [Methanococcoides burtonii]ABE52494.1 methyltransferase [Methanococcoides burtonii DSM 6242]
MVNLLKRTIEALFEYARLNSKSFQDYINTRYIPKENHFLIDEKYLRDCTYKIDGYRFYVTRCMHEADTINEAYNYSDIKKDDIVVDIGANIGGFSVRVANKCKHVYAVEPLFNKQLENNFKLNGITNYTIIPKGLGSGYKDLQYENLEKSVECVSLESIKKEVGGKIDFLKIDCEGGEWSIRSSELSGVRRIEMELHLFNRENKNDFLKILEDAQFYYDITPISKRASIIHATKKD